MTIPPEIEQQRQLFVRLMGLAKSWVYWVGDQAGEHEEYKGEWHLDNCQAAIDEMRDMLDKAEAVLTGVQEWNATPRWSRDAPKGPASLTDTVRCRVYEWTTLSPGHPVVARWHPEDSESQGLTCARVDNDGYFHMDLGRASNHQQKRIRIYSTGDFNDESDGLLDRTIRVPDQPSAQLSCLPEAGPLPQDIQVGDIVSPEAVHDMTSQAFDAPADEVLSVEE